MANEGEFPKVDGDILYASDVNYLHSPVFQVYAGSGFDVAAKTNVTAIGSVALDAITTGSLRDANYINISATVQSSCQGIVAGTGDVENSISYEAQAIGGSYVTSMPYMKLQQIGDIADVQQVGQTIKWLHELTANEKNLGVQIKVATKTVVQSAGISGLVSNIQTSLVGC